MLKKELISNREFNLVQRSVIGQLKDCSRALLAPLSLSSVYSTFTFTSLNLVVLQVAILLARSFIETARACLPIRGTYILASV